jgi:hypothetical protein
MRVTVVYHDEVREPLRAWLAELTTREPGGPILARVAIEVTRNRFVECGGDPPESRDDAVRGPSVRWWMYSEGFWLGYMIRDQGIGPWRTRRVIIVEARVYPPGQGP